MENNLELLPLTDDYIFKRVFAYKGNESVLKDFLEALLKIEIKGIKITNPEIIPYEKGEKELSKFTKLDQWMCIFTQNKEGIMLAEKENKEIKRAINTLDFLSKDPKERERHNSIVMAEYNRLVSEHNFFNDGLEKGMKKRNEKTVKKKIQ